MRNSKKAKIIPSTGELKITDKIYCCDEKIETFRIDAEGYLIVTGPKANRYDIDRSGMLTKKVKKGRLV